MPTPVLSDFVNHRPDAASLPSDGFDAEVLLRFIEAAAGVQRRHQFFVCVSSYLQVLLPHQLLICGAYQRSARALVFEAFENVPLPGSLLTQAADAQSPLLREVTRLWVARGPQSMVVDLATLSAAAPEELLVLRDNGITQLLVHGVARPYRPKEVESLFMFAAQAKAWEARHGATLNLVLPQVHAAYVRMCVLERELGDGRTAAPRPPVPAPRVMPLTERERQILAWVREGKNNAEIAVLLSISALTVKNHVQKILRKLSAANRAQAVGRAIGLNLL